MSYSGQFKAVTVAFVALVSMVSEAGAAQCGNTAAGFEAWKTQFANEARGRGVQRVRCRSPYGNELFDRNHRSRPRPEKLSLVARSVSGQAWRQAPYLPSTHR